jgi:hypothetical protein
MTKIISLLIFKIWWLGLVAGVTSGCVHQVVAYPPQDSLREPLVFGQIELWQAEPSGRWYLPELSKFEFIEKEGGRRYRMKINASSFYFFLSLDPGQYRITRVFIKEGAFRANADVPLEFEVPEQGIVYLGTWRFHIKPPNFVRMLEVKILSQPKEGMAELKMKYPSFSLNSVQTQLAEPFELRSRLYPITPYPRIWWFSRQHTT